MRAEANAALKRRAATLVGLLLLAVPAPAQELRFAELGDVGLDNGALLRGCRLEYCTFGRLDPARPNAILVPNWFTGKTAQVAPALVGEGRLLDPSKYFVVVVGSIGNGVSTSPSNSALQARAAFPHFGIPDMVEMQHRLLTRTLGIKHLRAIVGVSMGGMQAFQWALSHPGFMDKIVPIVGSPRLAPSDLLLWQAELMAIEQALARGDTPESRKAAMNVVTAVHEGALRTPDAFNALVDRASFEAWLAGRQQSTLADNDPWDWASCLRAMIGHDVAAPYGGSLDRAAARVKARALVVVASQDHMVHPGPALEFARALGGRARTLVLTGDCGHLANGCEGDRVRPAVAGFLAE